MSQLSEAMKNYNKACEESKSTMESINKFQNDLMTALDQHITNLDTFKQELINIVLSGDNEDKLKELRICILKFKPIQVKVAFPKSNSEIRDKLNEAALVVLENIKEYGQFKEDIANIIRDTDKTVENKIETILNILM